MNSSKRENPTQDFARRASGAAHGLLTIAQLQLQLFLLDMRQLCTRVIAGLAAWLIAACFLFASVPLALAGAGLWLAAYFEESPGIGLLWAGLAAMLLAVVLVAAGWWQLRGRLRLERSSAELRRNMALVTQMLSDLSIRNPK